MRHVGFGGFLGWSDQQTAVDVTNRALFGAVSDWPSGAQTYHGITGSLLTQLDALGAGQVLQEKIRYVLRRHGLGLDLRTIGWPGGPSAGTLLGVGQVPLALAARGSPSIAAGIRPGSASSVYLDGNESNYVESAGTAGDYAEYLLNDLTVAAWVQVPNSNRYHPLISYMAGGESQATNILVKLSLTSAGEVRLHWEYGDNGADVQRDTSGANLQPNRPYRVVLRRAADGSGTFTVDVFVFDLQANTFRRWTWYNLAGPSGGASGQWRVGADITLEMQGNISDVGVFAMGLPDEKVYEIGGY